MTSEPSSDFSEAFEHISTLTAGTLAESEAFFGRQGCRVTEEEVHQAAVELHRLSPSWTESEVDNLKRNYALACKMGGGMAPESADDLTVWEKEREADTPKLTKTFEGFRERVSNESMIRLSARLEAIASGGEYGSSAGSRRGVIISGPPGTYKSWLVDSLSLECRKQGVSAYTTYVYQLVEDVQATYKNGGSESDVFRMALESRVICLDDLGREKDTPDSRRIVQRLIEEVERHRDSHVLVVATNLELDRLNEVYDEAVVSRIRGLCAGFRVPIEDTRGREEWAS